MDDVMRIPLAIPDADGFPVLSVEPHEYGDQKSVTIRVPPECKGKLNLPRALLREMAAWREAE